jgi:hypothetical protein
MVLESLVADLLNRYLGDFVVNLDPKQLNLGIWGGNLCKRISFVFAVCKFLSFA